MTEPLRGEHGPPPVDPRPRQLLEKYASLVGTVLLDTGEGLVEFEVPTSEWRFWGASRVVTIALAPEALAEDPEAELLGIGSPVFERLVEAIRTRGFHTDNGLVAPAHDPTEAMVAVPIPVEGAAAGPSRTELSILPIGRLVARVSIKAGAVAEERLVESAPVDLSTGVLAPDGLIGALGATTHSTERPPAAVAVPRRAMDRLLPLVFGHLESELRSQLTKLGQTAEQGRRQELGRLERYYQTMINETEADASDDAAQRKRMIEAEHGRRRGEEEERSKTKITVHPIQLLEWQVLAQRITWPLTTPNGRRGDLSATRLLTGDTAWRVACPTCGTTPNAARVCRDGHVACPDCSGRCTVCGDFACRSHGLADCQSGAHLVCGEHHLTCRACGKGHCEQHSGRCAAADHLVCPDCAVTCANCGIGLCRPHAVQTGQAAPKGQRWLCDSCVVLCEGGSNEPVGVDESVRCSACERHICLNHRAVCAVDGQVQCSRHLRRSDRSGRLACETHRASCADEPDSILASDEVRACATCERPICEAHGADCVADGHRHCNRHLAPLADAPGRRGCEQHRTTCHVDGVTFSLTGTRECPVCGKAACEAHRVACPSCARQVCIRDFEGARCLTCHQLDAAPDLGDDLIQAALAANNGEPLKAKQWRTARDATATVVEADLGWTRRLVFTVRHGGLRPQTVVQHSLLGSKRLR